jgi:hypothetical protein
MVGTMLPSGASSSVNAVGDTVECKHVCDNGSIVHHHRFSVDAKVISAPCTVATIISFTTMSESQIH